MLDYARLVIAKATKGFALRIDLWYGVAGVIVAGATGSRERPLGALTPFEIARYLLVAVVVWWAFRLLLLAPYRVWEEQRAVIAGLRDDLAKPERLGAETMHRIRAEKRIDLAAKLQEYHWRRLRGENDLADKEYGEFAKLIAATNVPPAFNWLLGELVEVTARPGEANELISHDLVRGLCCFLHGTLDEEALIKRRWECENATRS